MRFTTFCFEGLRSNRSVMHIWFRWGEHAFDGSRSAFKQFCDLDPFGTQQRHYFRYCTVHTLCLHLPPLHFMTTNSPRNPCEGKHIIPLHFFTLNMERTINNKICTYPVHRLDIGVPFKPLGCVSPLFNSLCNTLICVLNNDVTHLLWKELAIDQQKNK